MQTLQIILSIISIFTILFLFLRPKIGVMAYMVYMFFAPNLIVGNTILGTRTEAIILLFAFWITMYRKTPPDLYKSLHPFFVFYGLQLLFVPFSFDVGYSFDTWMIAIAKLFFFVFLLSAIYREQKAGNSMFYTKVLYGVFVIIIAYGLILTTIPGLNPYQMMLKPIFGMEFNEAYAAGNGGASLNTNLASGRIFGRISSFFGSPQMYALDLGFMALMCLGSLSNSNKVAPICMFFITMVAIFTSGVRTPIAAISITILFVLLYLRKYQYLFFVLAILVAVFNILPYIYPNLVDYINSIVGNGSDSEIKGSSLEMRLGQLEGCWQIVEDTLVFGRGLGWTGWYLNKFGGHPQALYFESIVFSVMCDMGIIGFIIWGLFGYLYYKIVNRNILKKSYRAVLYAIFVYYLAYTGITGDYGYMSQFVLFFVILYSQYSIVSYEKQKIGNMT